MKVNDNPIFVCVRHKDVLVEKTIKKLKFPEAVPVYHSFNYGNVIGTATLKSSLGKIYADIVLLADIKGFPAIAFIEQTNMIYALSIGPMRNKDSDIKAIL